MNKPEIVRLTVTFTTLLIIGIVLAVSAQGVNDAFTHLVLVAMGSALVGGSLAFYLNQMFALDREAKKSNISPVPAYSSVVTPRAQSMV